MKAVTVQRSRLPASIQAMLGHVDFGQRPEQGETKVSESSSGVCVAYLFFDFFFFLLLLFIFQSVVFNLDNFPFVFSSL